MGKYGPRFLGLKHSQRLILFLLATSATIFGILFLAFSLLASATLERELEQLQAQVENANRAELEALTKAAETVAASSNSLADAVAGLEEMPLPKDIFVFIAEKGGTLLALVEAGDASQSLRQAVAANVPVALTEQAEGRAGHFAVLGIDLEANPPREAIAFVSSASRAGRSMGALRIVDEAPPIAPELQGAIRRDVQADVLALGGIAALGVFLALGAGVGLNIFERRREDRKLLELTHRVLHVQDEERKRVSRELQDSVAQILVSARYYLDLVRRGDANGDAVAERALERSLVAVSSAISEIRRISLDLRPRDLSELGIGRALRTLVEEFSDRTQIRTKFETVHLSHRLDQRAQSALYRVAQEALANVERHSGADFASVRIYGHQDGATLRITDNGHGMRSASEAQLPTGGHGFRQMEDRVAQIGGQFSVTSSLEGTMIEVDIPKAHILPPKDTSPKTPA